MSKNRWFLWLRSVRALFGHSTLNYSVQYKQDSVAGFRVVTCVIKCLPSGHATLSLLSMSLSSFFRTGWVADFNFENWIRQLGHESISEPASSDATDLNSRCNYKDRKSLSNDVTVTVLNSN